MNCVSLRVMLLVSAGCSAQTGDQPWSGLADAAAAVSAPSVALDVNAATANASANPTARALPSSMIAPTSAGQRPVASSVRSNLQWKRYAALEADLMAALELPREALCSEFGLASCVHDVHLGPLGGNDPFRNGLLEPTAEPLVTTPMAVDRVVLSACGARAELELQAAQPSQWFGGLTLSGDAPAASSPLHRALVTTLYQRLLARDPEEQEIATLGELTADAAGQMLLARDYAISACYAIGTSTEFLFF